jgi:alpha-ribazole phosphatase
MEIYLIRHTKPFIENGICYGQTDVPVDEVFFAQQAEQIISLLPHKIAAIYSSPLSRCSRLAKYIQQEKYPGVEIMNNGLLMEMNFGIWENKKWNDLDQGELGMWMKDFVDKPTPGGENYINLFARAIQSFEQISKNNLPAIVVTHSGVIRSILSFITGTTLKDSFAAFDLKWGAIVVIKTDWQNYAGKRKYYYITLGTSKI